MTTWALRDDPMACRQNWGHPLALANAPTCDWGCCSALARAMVAEGEEWTRSFRHDTTVRWYTVGRARFSLDGVAL